MENFILIDTSGGLNWVIKVCEEDDNLFELYGGISKEIGAFMFVITFPYYVSEKNDTSSSSSSTYSLRKTNPIDGLRKKFEQMRQQMLDKSAE